jgi:hypothetical protein
MRLLSLLTALLLMVVPSLSQQTAQASPSAADVSALQQKLQDLEDRVVMLEGQIRQLKAQQPAAGAPATAPAAAAAPATAPGAQTQPTVTTAQGAAGATSTGAEQVRLGGAGVAAAKALNPDISVIGDFIGSAGHNAIVPTPSFQMHESEIGMQAIVDPYARADFFISFGEEGVDLEEGYITFTALPKGFVARAGKMRSAFGKVNTMHNHVLPWVDRPLVSQNLVGGEDGIDDAGVSIDHIIPGPKNWFLNLTGQVFRGDSADVFKSFVKNDISTVDHFRAYRDLTDNSNIDLGASYSRGHTIFGSNFVANLYGVDATYRWKPLMRSIYKSFVARTELIWRQQQQPSAAQCLANPGSPGTSFPVGSPIAIPCPTGPEFRPGFQRSFGFYTSGDYQFRRRWFLGARVDHADRPFNSRLADNGGSLILTYWPSEFAQIRGQYRYTRYGENFNANEVFAQVVFALGAHGAHPF